MTRALVVIQSQADRDRASRWAQGVPMGSRIEFKETKRTIPQNDRLWAMLTDVAIHMKKLGRDHTPDQWKVIFMAAYGHEVKFLPTLDQKSFIPLGHSSSDLSVKEMTDLIEFMLAWGAEAGVIFNDPKDTESGARPLAGTADEPPSSSSSAEPADAAPDSAGSPIPDAPNGGPASGDDLTDGDVSSSTSPSAGSVLIDFARDILTTAAAEGATNATLDVIAAEYRDKINSLTKDEAKLAKGMLSTARSIASKTDGEDLKTAVAYYSGRLGCSPEMIGGAA